MLDPALYEELLEFALPAPGVILAAVVREEFVGHPVVFDGVADDVNRLAGGRIARESPCRHEPRVVVEAADKVDAVEAAQHPREGVHLVELARFGALESLRLG